MSSATAGDSIDLDAAPFVPDGWAVEEHKLGGRFIWDPAKVCLHLTAKQVAGGWIEIHEIRKELETLPVLNANVLDHLLANPHLIPKEWKDEAKDIGVFFWGTIYRSPGFGLCVRCLHWKEDRHHGYWSEKWVDFDWYPRFPTAVLMP